MHDEVCKLLRLQPVLTQDYISNLDRTKCVQQDVYEAGHTCPVRILPAQKRQGHLAACGRVQQSSLYIHADALQPMLSRTVEEMAGCRVDTSGVHRTLALPSSKVHARPPARLLGQAVEGSN